MPPSRTPQVLPTPSLAVESTAAPMAATWRRMGEPVVFTNGRFDQIRAGHIELLPFAVGDYEKLFAKVASAIKPSDIIGGLFMKDVTGRSREIRRDRITKAETIRYYQKEIVAGLIKSELAPSGQYETAYLRIFKAGADLASWACDPKARAEIDQELAAKGYDASFILAQAYVRGAAEIEAIDKRIAFHEQGRSAALKDAGIWSDRLLRRLDQAMPGVIEGEFTEAVEQD